MSYIDSIDTKCQATKIRLSFDGNDHHRQLQLDQQHFQRSKVKFERVIISYM